MTKPAAAMLQCSIAAALQQLVYKISLTCKDWALFNCTARKFSVHFQQLNNLGWLSYPSSTPAPYGWSSRSVLAKFWSSPSSTGKSVQIERTISRSTSTCKSPLSECQPAQQHIQICKRMCTSLETDCTGEKKTIIILNKNLLMRLMFSSKSNLLVEGVSQWSRLS